MAETAVDVLARHWTNERHAPEILPAQEALLSSILDRLNRQSEAVQTLRRDPSASEDEHLRITLVQLDIERVKFIVRSYVRTRLYKIEKYARHITQSPSIQTRLTAAERDHSLPEPQRHLDDEVPYYMPSMVTTPDMTRPVFVHALQDCPSSCDSTRVRLSIFHRLLDGSVARNTR